MDGALLWSSRREVSVDLATVGDLNFGHLAKLVSARLLCRVVTVIPLC